MTDKTIFSKIIDREIPGHFVYEDEVCVVIMDAFPSVPGQTLVIPRAPVDYLFDLPTETYQRLLAATKKIAKAMDLTFDTSRTCVVVEGFEVPHTHIKLYPLAKNETALTNVIMQTKPANQAQLAQQCTAIKAALTSD